MWPSVAHARATWVLMGAESLCGWALPSGPAPCWPVYSYVPITGAPVHPPPPTYVPGLSPYNGVGSSQGYAC